MQLKIENLVFGYGKSDILKEICLDIGPSEVVGIVGPNGSGKTTLIKCINRILEPRQGHILLDGEDICRKPQSEVARSLSYVPQNSRNEVCTPNVYEVVAMGRRPHIKWQMGKKDEDIVWESMVKMGVKELASHSFDSLSSGQTQRVLLARALAQEAEILLLDEPTSNLDVRYQIDVMETIRELVHTMNLGAITIIHDLDLAIRFCDKVIVLKDGVVKAFGSLSEVMTPEIVKDVFGVDVYIVNDYGRLRVLIE